MTTARPGAEFKMGDSVAIKVGVATGKTGRITKVYPTQNTVRGTETRFLYKTSVSPEHYRAQDLQKG